MPDTFRLSSVLLCCALFFQCASPTEPGNNPPRELTTLERELVSSDNRFGLKLFREIMKTETDKNAFISPLSVSMALGMTLNGADGETKEAMEETLELAGLTTEEINQSYKSLIELLTNLDPQVVFDIANSIWYRLGMTFEQEFIDRNETYFNALVRALDFNSPDAVDTINGWVEENTNGKIDKIIQQIDPMAVMFLINAIYFKGTWTTQFDEEDTRDDWFNLPDGTQVPCKMMSQEAEFAYFSNELFQAIDLPYGDGLFSMTVLLPHGKVDIDSLIAAVDQQTWDGWMGGFSTAELTLYFPKFELEYELKLNDALSALGMETAFDPYSADFTRMYAHGGLFISEVKHKTYVKVDEEGTEAAAVTSVEFEAVSLPPMMRVDRPFIFAIRENHSGTILFIGKIVEPAV